jgi:hypothetical protein
MAEDRMMTAADVVAKAMGGEHGDLLRDAVALVVRELMEAEVQTLTGAGRGERSPERVTNLKAIASGRGRPGSARSSWRSRGRGRGRRTSRRSWSRVGAASRRSWRW